MGFFLCRGRFDWVRHATDGQKNNKYWYDSLKTKDFHKLNNPVIPPAISI
jgi:hypothetical protein